MMTKKSKPKPLTRETATPDQWRCFIVLLKALNSYLCYLKVYPCGKGIRVSFMGDIATHDSNLLTRLVLAAHRYAVRISITNGGPRRVAIEAHPRDPNSKNHLARHPSVGELQGMADAWKQLEEIEEPSVKGGAQ